MGDLFYVGGGLLPGRLRRRRGPLRRVCGSGLLHMGRPQRGLRSGRELGRSEGTVCVLGDEGDAEAVLQSRSDKIRIPVKEEGCGSAHKPGSRYWDLLEFERTPVCLWPLAASCPECERHTSWTSCASCVSRCLSAMLRRRGWCAGTSGSGMKQLEFHRLLQKASVQLPEACKGTLLCEETVVFWKEVDHTEDISWERGTCASVAGRPADTSIGLWATACTESFGTQIVARDKTGHGSFGKGVVGVREVGVGSSAFEPSPVARTSRRGPRRVVLV